MCNERRILLIIGGGIAAYKCLELIRRGRERGLAFRCVLTAAASQFVTPLSVASLAGEKVYDQLFSLTDEAEMGHIRLSREADLVVVAPATADLMAKMAAGLADDLASTLLLASDKPVLVAPAMNPQMWSHPATRRNLARLAEDGVHLVGPNPGDMACGEVGSGRMAEPHEILAAIEALLAPPARPLAGMRAIVTSGPTREPLDPVRFLSNHSSGRQGHAIARALAEAGADGRAGRAAPSPSPIRRASRVVHVETAREMLAAVEDALPAEIAVCAAAVADWRPVEASGGQDQEARGRSTAHDRAGREPGHPADAGRPCAASAPRRRLRRRDRRSRGSGRGRSSRARAATGSSPTTCRPARGVFGGERNRILLLTGPGPAEAWPELDKTAVARRLAERIAATLAGSVVHA